MDVISQTTTNQPVAERRRPVSIPAPLVQASKELRNEFELLSASSNSLEDDRKHAALHRETFSRELEEVTGTTSAIMEDPQGQKIAVESGRSIVWEAGDVRDRMLELLRKELALRNNLETYLKHWRAEGVEILDFLRTKLAETRTSVHDWLVKGDSKFGGYHDPVTNKLSPCRVMPGYIASHPAVFEVRTALVTADRLTKDKSHATNRREIEDLRMLIRQEANRLAGFPN